MRVNACFLLDRCVGHAGLRFADHSQCVQGPEGLNTTYACTSPLPLGTTPSAATALTPLTCSHTRHDRFCSLSWYDRQLVENSRSGAKDGGSAKGDGEEEEEGGEALGAGDAGATDTTSLFSSPRPHGSDAGFGVGFGVRARPAEASVMATLKARGEMRLMRVDCSTQGCGNAVGGLWGRTFASSASQLCGCSSFGALHCEGNDASTARGLRIKGGKGCHLFGFRPDSPPPSVANPFSFSTTRPRDTFFAAVYFFPLPPLSHLFTRIPPHQDLDPWVTAPLFEDECNSMDPIHAMVSGRPPFAAAGSDGSSTGPRDCPSPPTGRPGDGPLDGLCESWEEGQEVGGSGSGRGSGGVGADALEVAPADTASMQEFRQAYEGLVGGGIQGEMPEAARVGDLVNPNPNPNPNPVAAGLSASAPAATPSSTGLVQAARATPLGAYHSEDAAALFSAEAVSPGPSSASATPPPVPAKPASLTAAFIIKESSANAEPLALYGGANEAAAVGGADAGAAPGTITSRDLLLEWLRREAEQGDEEAQFHLAQLFSPPRFEMKPECRECGELFGVTRYRHHCRHCGGSFCHEHAWHEHPIPKLGLPAAQVGGEYRAKCVLRTVCTSVVFGSLCCAFAGQITWKRIAQGLLYEVSMTTYRAQVDVVTTAVFGTRNFCVMAPLRVTAQERGGAVLL